MPGAPAVASQPDDDAEPGVNAPSAGPAAGASPPFLPADPLPQSPAAGSPPPPPPWSGPPLTPGIPSGAGAPPGPARLVTVSWHSQILGPPPRPAGPSGLPARAPAFG